MLKVSWKRTKPPISPGIAQKGLPRLDGTHLGIWKKSSVCLPRGRRARRKGRLQRGTNGPFQSGDVWGSASLGTYWLCTVFPASSKAGQGTRTQENGCHKKVSKVVWYVMAGDGVEGKGKDAFLPFPQNSLLLSCPPSISLQAVCSPSYPQ